MNPSHFYETKYLTYELAVEEVNPGDRLSAKIQNRRDVVTNLLGC
jgi:hypothetical protein